MKSLFKSLLLILFSIAVYGQQPELVVDFTPGEEDSFDQWNFKGYQLGNSIIVPLVSPDLGQELAIIKDGEIKIIKDINPGPESSKPGNFFIYDNELLFTAEDGQNGVTIWKTDGTEQGTVEFLNPGSANSRPRSFVTAENGWLYFYYNGNILRTNGTELEELYEDANLSQSSLVVYGNGIVFLTKNDDDSFSLRQIEDDTPVELTRTEETGFFADGFGVSSVKNGILFNINDSDIDGLYIYNETDQSHKLLKVDGFELPARKQVKINQDVNLCWFQAKGYYAVNGVEGEEILVHESQNFAATQGESINYGQLDENIIFVPLNPGWAAEEFLLMTDGTGTANNLFELENSLISDMIQRGKYGFIADGISNNFQPNLYQVDMESGEVETLYNFEERSTRIESILPLGVVDNQLYFINKLDRDIGAELYRLELDVMLSTEETESSTHPSYKLIQSDNIFEIKTEEPKTFDLTVMNIMGQVIDQRQVEGNNLFEVGLSNGAYLLKVSANGQSLTEMVYISGQ